jgi:hypothetical protein
MEILAAQKLVDAFGEQFRSATIDRKLFLDVLVEANIPESARFSEELPNNQQTISEADRYHYLSLRRVLRNGNARSYQLSGAKKALARILGALGIYSSDVLTRGLRSDPEIVELMNSSTSSFSLLGKFETYDSSNPEALFRKTQPFIIIPGAKNWVPLARREYENTVYEKESGFILKTFKQIDKREYIGD